jgi:nucleoid-associated protein YgaU
MIQDKKIQLSQKLRLGIEGPSSQALLFKSGGVFFLILSMILGFNIYKSLQSTTQQSVTVVSSEQNNQGFEVVQPEVLGAYDSTTEDASETINYTVQKGDTLFNIAQNNNINWVIIATLNDLKAPYTLKPGTVIQIPAEK